MRDGAEVARRAHNPKVVGSNPAPATKTKKKNAKRILLFFMATSKNCFARKSSFYWQFLKIALQVICGILLERFLVSFD